MNNLLAIDTGIKKVGFAYWHKADYKLPKAPDIAGIFKLPERTVEHQHTSAACGVRSLMAILRIIGAKYDFSRHGAIMSVKELFIEGQQVRKDAVGLAAGGDIVNLASVAGAMAAWQYVRNDGLKRRLYHATIIQPKDWKGQMSKTTVADRITRMIGDEDCIGTQFNGDAWDAVGIGLVAQGHSLSDLNKVKPRRSL